MLQSFKDRIQHSKWLGYGIVIAICIPFALWGIQSYVGGPEPQIAAEVNGEPIKEQRVSQMVSQQRQRLREQFQGKLDGLFSDGALRERVLDQLITRELLQQVAANAGFRATDAMVAQRIRQQQPFQRGGQFDRELYRERLSRAGLTPAQYEQRVRAGERVEQLRRGITDTVLSTDGQARQAAQLRHQERQISVITQSRERALDEIEVSRAEMKRYYRNNQEAFQTPRRVRLAYIDLSIDDLKSQVDISEDALRSQYEANRDQYRAAAERKASHILLEVSDEGGTKAREDVRQKANKLADRVKQGADLAALARQYSDDKGSAENSGSLGYMARGSMVKPFEKALFGLDEVGTVTGPVETQYGFHIIRLDDIREPKPKPFEKVKDKIRDKLAAKRAERLFYERVELLKNEAYENPSSLQPAAKALGVDVQRSDWLSRNEGTEIASNDAIRNAAFSKRVRQEQRNSDVIELGQRRVAVLRVVVEKAPQAKPLAQVRDQIYKKLQDRKLDERLRHWADRTIQRLEQGTAPAGLAVAPRISVVERKWVQASGTAGLDKQIIERAYSMPAPSAVGSTYAKVGTQKGFAVIALHQLRTPEIGEDGLEKARGQLRSGLSQAEFGGWMGALKANADIVRQDENSREKP
jgi:peptidyl-prolyl cis-trans isomerase D